MVYVSTTPLTYSLLYSLFDDICIEKEPTGHFKSFFLYKLCHHVKIYQMLITINRDIKKNRVYIKTWIIIKIVVYCVSY